MPPAPSPRTVAPSDLIRGPLPACAVLKVALGSSPRAVLWVGDIPARAQSAPPYEGEVGSGYPQTLPHAHKTLYLSPMDIPFEIYLVATPGLEAPLCEEAREAGFDAAVTDG